MASKGRKDAVTLRKISKPVISTDVMGNRNVEVRAVGAWVEAEPALREPEAVVRFFVSQKHARTCFQL